MKTIAQYRYRTNGVLQSSYRNGDLYRISFIPGFKNEIRSEMPIIKTDSCNCPRSINLYGICDSYLYTHFNSDSLFCGVKSFKYAKWGSDKIEVRLDPTQVNVLLLEVVERYFRARTLDDYFYMIRNVNATSHEKMNKRTIERMTAGVMLTNEELVQLHKILFNPEINQNLEFNLFDYSVFNHLKEMKAGLNYKIFGRTPQEISILDGYNYLFLNETVDSSSSMSSFRYLQDQEVDDIVTTLNEVYKHFKKNGFTEVVLSVAPNPVSVISPQYGKYNDIIRSVKNHPGLIMPVIDVYDKLASAPCPVYFNSDSHWNINGFNIWLNEFNKYLSTVSK